MIFRIRDYVDGLVKRTMGYTQQLLQARIPGVPNTMARIPVNEQTALRYSAVYACIRCISETKGSLPYEVLDRNPKTGKESVTTQHPVAQLLAYEPHNDMTPMCWAESRQADVLTGGNSYVEITFDGQGIPTQLTPRHWTLVRPYRDMVTHELLYEVRDSNVGKVRILDRSQMLHIPGFGTGIIGWSPIRMQAELIGLAMGQDKWAAAFFGNAATPNVAVTVPGILSDDAYARLKTQTEQQYTGDNAHRPFLVEMGATITPLTFPAKDAQLIEACEFSEERVCRIFRVPPHMIGLLRRATFSNIEAQDLSYEKHTMRPWVIRDEQELNRKLFLQSERGRFRVRINVDDLLRADIKTRYDSYKTGILAGFMSRNEARQKEHWPSVKGLDEILAPQAIFGKGGDSRSSAPRSEFRAPRSTDPRLVALVLQTITGLDNREATHAERAASKPNEFRASIEALADKQRSLAAEKLSMFPDLRPVVERIERHRDELISLGSGDSLQADVISLAATWPQDRDQAASALLSGKA